MNFSETISVDPQQLVDLKRLIRQGEGIRLEFKLKVAHPDKVIRELIAFANTEGGVLLVGVADDGDVRGVKYPEEELLTLRNAVSDFCRPVIVFRESVIPISQKRFIVRLDIPVSERRPHFFAGKTQTRECIVRVKDKSIKASKEVHEIVRRSRKKRDIRFTFGESEKKLMEYLDQRKVITLDEFRRLAGLNRFKAAKKLILLVLANVLQISPSEKGDLYSRLN